MAIDTSKTVREFALELPSSVQLFEKLGVDYCCSGHKPLVEACAAAGVSLESVSAALEKLGNERQAAQANTRNWAAEPLEELVAHIQNTHHVYVKQQAPAIQALAQKVTAVHGANHPELAAVSENFAALANELSMHLMKEEQILFPYIVKAEESSLHHEPAPHSCFGSIENPIRMMLFEHDNAGTVLRELRKLTSDYTVPEDACTSFRALYTSLQEFEADLHQHIHLENNILFPRALQTAGLAVAV